jgi:cytochrome c oxidase assembly factor CtaG
VFAGTVAIALLSPLEPASHTSLTAHVVQHILLIGIAAPALALTFTPVSMSSTRWHVHVAAALVTTSMVVVGWHAPVAFDAAIRHGALHGLEHLTMTAAAAYLWWALATTRPARGGSDIALFVSTIPLTILGLTMLLSRSPWYAAYPDLYDQQVAGAVVWGVGGGVAWLEGVTLFVVWIRSVERRSELSPKPAVSTDPAVR